MINEIKGQPQNYFGVKIPLSTTVPVTIPLSYNALLLSTEFKFNTKLLGIQLFMENPANVTFYVS